MAAGRKIDTHMMEMNYLPVLLCSCRHGLSSSQYSPPIPHTWIMDYYGAEASLAVLGMLGVHRLDGSVNQ